MYLTEPAIEATLAAVHEYSCDRSLLAFTYNDFNRQQRPRLSKRIAAAIAGRAGEPWIFGWKPEELPGWMQLRGFHVRENENEVTLAQRYLPPKFATRFDDPGRCIAVAEVERRMERGTLH
jgi:O-methyltransferase involved in polyketide biosynthesis